MGEDVRHPVRGPGLSSLCLQEKKGVRLTRWCWCVRLCVSLPVFFKALTV